MTPAVAAAAACVHAAAAAALRAKHCRPPAGMSQDADQPGRSLCGMKGKLGSVLL